MSSVPVVAVLSVEFAVALLSCDIRSKLSSDTDAWIAHLPFIIIATVTLVRSRIEATYSLSLLAFILQSAPVEVGPDWLGVVTRTRRS